MPLSNFYKIWHGRGSPRTPPSRQISPLSLVKFELIAHQIPKIGIFRYKFVQKGYTPLRERFLQNFAWEGVPAPYPHAKFNRCDFKQCELTAPKSRKMVILV